MKKTIALILCAAILLCFCGCRNNAVEISSAEPEVEYEHIIMDENGNFMWPGFGDNMRVLDWIIKRCEGEVDAEETAIGYLPKAEDINLEGIEDEVTPEVLEKLLAVDKDLWTAEIAEMRRYYNDDLAAKGARIPEALIKELDMLEERLAK